MMKHAWNSYVAYAWGYDQLDAVNKEGAPVEFGDGLEGATIVDALDTLYIMGLKDEYQKARTWIDRNLTFDQVYFCLCPSTCLCFHQVYFCLCPSACLPVF